mmetsp:Transcript_9875/g.14519  ORF Transcript_9875/g.14519 Transcript_9875/m.14519 type:complete len:102 (+) Transcript_9875:1-306(+)
MGTNNSDLAKAHIDYFESDFATHLVAKKKRRWLKGDFIEQQKFVRWATYLPSTKSNTSNHHKSSSCSWRRKRRANFINTSAGKPFASTQSNSTSLNCADMD